VQVLFQGRRPGIQPMLGADEVLQGPARQDIFDAEGNHRDDGVHRPFDLAPDLGRSVGVRRKDQDHGPGLLDGLHNGLAPIAARQDIPGRDPATDTVGLQGGDNSIGRGLVLTGIAHKNIMGHSESPRLT